MRSQLKWYTFRWQAGLAILVFAFLAWYLLAGRYMHPIGEGAAGPPVDPRPFSHIWSTEKVVLLGLGDSMTEGYGASPGHGYFDLLGSNDNAVYPDMPGRDLRHVFPKLETRNYSMSYTCSEEHLREQIPGVEVFPPDVRGIVVISTGGNDLIHDYGQSPPRDGAMYGCTFEQAAEWKESFRGRLEGIIEGINAKFPGGCDIFLANIYDPTDGVGDIENGHILLPPWPDGIRALGMFNEVIAETCDAYPNVHLVDIHSIMLGHGIHCRDRRNPHYDKSDPHYWYFKNLEDPNDRGYDAIRRAFLLEMVKAFCPRSGEKK